MTEHEIYTACKAIAAEAERRGIKYAQCNAVVRGTRDLEHPVWVYISPYSDTTKRVEGEGSTFADAIAECRAALDRFIPDEECLASILGYRDVQMEAAE